jgi:hypothetical protein
MPEHDELIRELRESLDYLSGAANNWGYGGTVERMQDALDDLETALAGHPALEVSGEEALVNGLRDSLADAEDEGAASVEEFVAVQLIASSVVTVVSREPSDVEPGGSENG